MSISITLIGGRDDGVTLTAPDDTPPPVYLIPETRPIAELVHDLGLAKPSFRTLVYRPALDALGFHSRSDDGAYRYALDPNA